MNSRHIVSTAACDRRHGPYRQPSEVRDFRVRALYNFNIQPAIVRPISSGESSWTKWIPATVFSVSIGHPRTLRYKLRLIGQSRQLPRDGSLMPYVVDRNEQYRQEAPYVDLILRSDNS